MIAGNLTAEHNNAQERQAVKQDMIVLLDLGSARNTVFARQIRDLGVYGEIHVKRIILNGGENRIVDGAAVEVRPELYDLGYPLISVDYPASRCETRLDELPDEAALKHFVFGVCGAEANGNMKKFIEAGSPLALDNG